MATNGGPASFQVNCTNLNEQSVITCSAFGYSCAFARVHPKSSRLLRPPHAAFEPMDGPPPPEEDFSSIPISDRLSHKNWKARLSAYESLIKTFQTTASDSDPAFKPYINNPDLLKKIAIDANAVAQEKGIECLVAFVKFAGENAARTRDVVVPALVDKCFGSARAGTKTQAIELSLQYVEVENGGAGVVVCLLTTVYARDC